MELNPVPVLMATVIYSNIGGSITPVGDPPNVIIASNQDMIDSVSTPTPRYRMLCGNALGTVMESEGTGLPRGKNIQQHQGNA
jgi:hypothetical protein